MSRTVAVYHSGYGCDTGCCGHIVAIGDEERFDFDHPGLDEDSRKFAEQLIRDLWGEEHVADLDWELCRISYD